MIKNHGVLILIGMIILIYGLMSFFVQDSYPLRSELIQTQGKVTKVKHNSRTPCRSVWYSFSTDAGKPLVASADFCGEGGGYVEGYTIDVAYNPNNTKESFILYEDRLYGRYERTKRGSLIIALIGLLIGALGGYELFKSRKNRI